MARHELRRARGCAVAVANAIPVDITNAVDIAVAATVALIAATGLGHVASAGALTFSTPPALPTLSAVTLNARAQTTNTQMTNFAVADTLESSWNITVAGNTAAGDSPVFAQYCPNTSGCGTDAVGYVPGGKTLPANSLNLNTTGASFTTTLGGPASFTCNTSCPIDTPTPSKIATESGLSALATWTSTGFSASSLALSTATTLKTLPASEVYRVNVIWTLSTGP